jgi:4a-hydroxytetrahydrobiopterin dehydratase
MDPPGAPCIGASGVVVSRRSALSDLAAKPCVPCQGGVPPLPMREAVRLLIELDGWVIEKGHHLTRSFSFPDFVQALAFVNRVGELAEVEAHHPSILLTWGKVGIEIWTHKIDGLTESDFILAAKIDELARQ